MRSFLAVLVLFATSALAADTDLTRELSRLEDRWALTKYEMTDQPQRLQNVEALHLEADAIVRRYPGSAEALIWHSLMFILEAEVQSNTASLRALRAARTLLEEAQTLDAAAMNGAVHTNLGSLYYEVPGWPMGFGDNKKAQEHLRTALAHDPEGREANYFYGDYLLQRRRAAEALPYLEKALQAPIDPDHARADKGRRGEVMNALEKAKAALTK